MKDYLHVNLCCVSFFNLVLLYFYSPHFHACYVVVLQMATGGPLGNVLSGTASLVLAGPWSNARPHRAHMRTNTSGKAERKIMGNILSVSPFFKLYKCSPFSSLDYFITLGNSGKNYRHEVPISAGKGKLSI